MLGGPAPNFGRLFGEAVRESIIDHYPRDRIEAGYFLIRLGRGRPLVPARIYWRDHEPGNEENKLDRWPLPALAGEIIGRYCDPVEVWTGRDREPLQPPAGYTVERWYQYLVDDASWAKEHAPETPIAKPWRKVDYTAIPPIAPPTKIEGTK
jgi:hypothetical protein